MCRYLTQRAHQSYPTSGILKLSDLSCADSLRLCLRLLLDRRKVASDDPFAMKTTTNIAGPGDHYCTATESPETNLARTDSSKLIGSVSGAGSKVAFDEAAQSTESFLKDPATISGKPYPARPDTIKFVQMPKTTENHTYRVFTNMPPDPTYSITRSLDQLNFHERLYRLLDSGSVASTQMIDWCFGGRAFYIRDVEGLLRRHLLQHFFGTNSIQRFRKQLVCHGYKRLVGNSTIYGNDCYYSEASIWHLRELYYAH